MTELLTSAQMRGIERSAISEGTVSAAALMERAGAGVVAAIAGRWPGLTGLLSGSPAGRAAVLCGPGNNGGDGYVVARLLAGAGWRVVVLAMPARGAPPVDAGLNAGRWRRLGGVVAPLDAAAVERAAAEGVDLWIDAIFGTGLGRPVTGEIAAAIGALAAAAGRKLAVDAPSGLCLDSGRVLGTACAPADLTVTFHRPKLGHVLAEGPALCGDVEVADIGLAGGVPAGAGPVARLIGAAGPGGHRPGKGAGKGAGHKYSHGHLAVLAGGSGQGGAARLAARAALRAGAGLVTLMPPAEAIPENAARLDAVMLRAVDAPADLEALLADRRITALCLGPGLGIARAAALLPVALADPARRVILDADALTALSPDAALGWGMGRALHPNCILTPHDGEFARLFPDLAAPLREPPASGPAWSRADAARAAAARTGATVLLKGPDTLIARAEGDLAVHAALRDRAAPWLATAGSGDVLAGIIGGLAAQGHAPAEAAEWAAWMHVEAARAFGPGLIAEDLPGMLPQVFRRIADMQAAEA